MKIDLTGKTAIVTGSTEGIGFGIARGLAQAGATVIVNGRTAEKMDAAVARLKAEFPDIEIRDVAADLGTADGCASLFAAEPQADILVNNMGIYQSADFFEASDEMWDNHWQVNVMSGVRLSRAYLPGMEKAGWGRVIFLGSESSFNIPSAMIHYGVSKTADVSLARGLAKRMAGTGVTVNSVLPGPTLTERLAGIFTSRPEHAGKTAEQAAADFVRQHRSSSILQRATSVEEVANMVVYVASKQASGTTGASLRVEGGIIDTL